ncbi:MAG: RNA-binding protein [Aphanocapsa lilacina HA4352-LM1]|jgi:RNA recognition motif-containing protein|nr:RNA-binding protein [Aphanocapsa lilacina HA4352-LM1]
MSVRLYVGNLPEEVTRQELEAVFAPAGEVVSLKVITDRKTGKCRGFGFLTVSTPEAADGFIEQFNGVSFKDVALRVEKAQPKAKSDRSDEGDGEAAAPAVAASGEATEPQVESAVAPRPVPARAAGPISTGRPPIRKADKSQRDRQGDGGRRQGDSSRRDRPAATSVSSDEANQPDPRWADALRDIRRQLTTKA